MPKYTLTYFNVKARGEFSRLLFAAAGVEFVDKRIEFGDWPALKEKTPQGSLPMLEIDGGPTIVQSFAISRYLAREFKLYGKDNLNMCIIDQLVDTSVDFMTALFPLMFIENAEEKAEKMKNFREKNLVNYLKYVNELVKQSGKKGFAVGDSLTLGDVAIHGSLDLLDPPASLEEYPLLAENKKTFEALPRIKAYLAKRK